MPANPWRERLAGYVQNAPTPAAAEAGTRMAAMIEETLVFGVPAPSVFAGVRAENGELSALWIGDVNRANVYLENGVFDVEVIPFGKPEPFSTTNPELAAAYVAGLHQRF